MEGEGDEEFQSVRRRKKKHLISREERLQHLKEEAVKGEALFVNGPLESLIAFYSEQGYLLRTEQGLWKFLDTGTGFIFDVLYAAVANNRLDALEFFLCANVPVLPHRYRTNERLLPHHLACVRGNQPALEMLLEYLTIGNADFLHKDLKDPRGYNSLLLATEACNLEIVQFLLQKGSKLTSKCAHGRNALHIIANIKESEMKKSDKMLGIHMELCRLFVEKGIPVNSFDKHKMTPIMFATQRGNQAMVRLLVTHGADVDREAPNFHTMDLSQKITVREHIIKKLGIESALSKAMDYGLNGRIKLEQMKQVQMSVSEELESVLGHRDTVWLILQFCEDDLGETKAEEEGEGTQVSHSHVSSKKRKKKKARTAALAPSRTFSSQAFKLFVIIALVCVAVFLASIAR